MSSRIPPQFVQLPDLVGYSKRLTVETGTGADKYSNYRQTQTAPYWNFVAPPAENGMGVALLPILLDKEHPEYSSVVLQVQNRKVFNHQIPIIELPAGAVDLGSSAEAGMHQEVKEEMRGYNIMKGADGKQKLIPLGRAVSTDPSVRIQLGLYAAAVERDPNASNLPDGRDDHEKAASMRTFEVLLRTFMDPQALDKALTKNDFLKGIIAEGVPGGMADPGAFLYTPHIGDARSRLPLKNKPEVDFQTLNLVG